MRGKGFTLIELVMVIVIIAILVTIAVPRLINLGRQAGQAACDANVAKIRAALINFHTDTTATGNSRFPASLNDAGFLAYLEGNALPSHPGAWPEGQSSYNDLYDPATGVINTHKHP
jgi:prepilin-type N-terminal cleavage/methylation domain-containing protein